MDRLISTKGLMARIQRKTKCNFITAMDIVDNMPTIQAIPLDKVKQAKEEIENIGMGSYLEITKEIECNNREVRMSKKFAIVILDKLIAESEEDIKDNGRDNRKENQI